MISQPVPDQQSMQIGKWGALAIDAVHRLRTSWKEGQRATTGPQWYVRRPRRETTTLSIDKKVRELKDDVQRAEDIAASVKSFVERIRQAGMDDKKAREFDELTVNPDLSKVMEIYKREYVAVAREQIRNLLKRVECWPNDPNSRPLKDSAPNPLVWRIVQLDVRLNEWTDELYRDHNNVLVMRLFTRVARHRPLTIAEKLRLDDAAKLDWKVKVQPSVHREDWYDEG